MRNGNICTCVIRCSCLFTDDHNIIIIVFVVLFSSTDTTLSEENVTKVFEVVRGDVHPGVGGSLGVPRSVLEKIQSTSQDVEQQWRAIGHYWLPTCTSVSWMVLAESLYQCGENEALQRVMPYLNKTRGMC